MRITNVEATAAIPALGEAAAALTGHFPEPESRHVLAMFSAFINSLSESPGAWPSVVRPHELREALQRAEDAEMSRDAMARKLSNMVDADVVEVKQRRMSDVLEALVDWWDSFDGKDLSIEGLETVVKDARRMVGK